MRKRYLIISFVLLLLLVKLARASIYAVRNLSPYFCKFVCTTGCITMLLFLLQGCPSHKDKQAFWSVKRVDSIEAYAEFVDNYPESEHAKKAKQIIKWRTGLNEDEISLDKIRAWLNDKRAYSHAKEIDTVESYERYIKSHQPNGQFLSAASSALERKRWDSAVKENTIEAYQLFLEKHCITNEYRYKASIAIDKVHFDNALKVNTIEAYQLFLEKHRITNEYKFAAEKRIALIWFREQKEIKVSYNITADCYCPEHRLDSGYTERAECSKKELSGVISRFRWDIGAQLSRVLEVGVGVDLFGVDAKYMGSGTWKNRNAIDISKNSEGSLRVKLHVMPTCYIYTDGYSYCRGASLNGSIAIFRSNEFLHSIRFQHNSGPIKQYGAVYYYGGKKPSKHDNYRHTLFDAGSFLHALIDMIVYIYGTKPIDKTKGYLCNAGDNELRSHVEQLLGTKCF